MSEQTEQPQRPKIRRSQAVNRLLKLYDEPRYLEIGVNKGKTFHKIRAAHKVAVDPKFLFDHEPLQRDDVRYHQVTSDEYFGTIVDPSERFDVIYLDGLHTLEQTLRDLLNALQHLQPDGVILIDDVRPPTALAAMRDLAEFRRTRRELGARDQRAWMGDVYRLVFFIDTFLQQLTYRTIDDNHGQAVVWRHRRPAVTDRLVADVGTLDFESFQAQQDVLRAAAFDDILGEIRADLGLRRTPGKAGARRRWWRR